MQESQRVEIKIFVLVASEIRKYQNGLTKGCLGFVIRRGG